MKLTLTVIMIFICSNSFQVFCKDKIKAGLCGEGEKLLYNGFEEHFRRRKPDYNKTENQKIDDIRYTEQLSFCSKEVNKKKYLVCHFHDSLSGEKFSYPKNFKQNRKDFILQYKTKSITFKKENLFYVFIYHFHNDKKNQYVFEVHSDLDNKKQKDKMYFFIKQKLNGKLWNINLYDFSNLFQFKSKQFESFENVKINK